VEFIGARADGECAVSSPHTHWTYCTLNPPQQKPHKGCICTGVIGEGEVQARHYSAISTLPSSSDSSSSMALSSSASIMLPSPMISSNEASLLFDSIAMKLPVAN